MAIHEERKLDLATMLGQVEQVVKRGKASDAPAYTLILGAGASFGVVPTARQMLGLPDRGLYHEQCIPAFLHEREQGAPPDPTELEECVRAFWQELRKSNDGRCSLKADEHGLPSLGAVPDAYKFLFSQHCVGGLNSSGDASSYLRQVTMGVGGKVRLNGTHFFLGSLLSLQNRSPEEKGAADRPIYVGKRPFARTIFTTNFDPLLQVSLQLFQNLYYMTDRPEQLPTDALHTDDHAALHLFYAHGSVHRPGPKNTDGEIRAIRDLNANPIAPYLATHGVIVLGYSGWDDCLLQALRASTSFKHNLYWLTRGETPVSEPVEVFLNSHPNAFLVPITDGGEFMAALHCKLCPGMAMTELLANPIAPLRDRLNGVDLTGISAESSAPSGDGKGARERPSTPEQLRQQVVALLAASEEQFTQPAATDDPLVELQKLEHQADLAYSIDDASALRLYDQIAQHPSSSIEAKALAMFRRGVCHAAAGRGDHAMADFTRVIELPGAPVELIASALYNRGVGHLRAGRKTEEFADFTRVIELPGASAEDVASALVNRAQCHKSAGRITDGILDVTQAIELPGAPAEVTARALVIRAGSYRELAQSANVIEDCTRVIELPGAAADSVAIALIERATQHRWADRSAEAISDLTRVIELPDAPPGLVAAAKNELRDISLQQSQEGCPHPFASLPDSRLDRP